MECSKEDPGSAEVLLKQQEKKIFCISLCYTNAICQSIQATPCQSRNEEDETGWMVNTATKKMF